MSQLAVLQGKPRVGIDHAAAAAVWAKQAYSPLAEAYAADRAVRAYVVDNQTDKYQEILDQEYTALHVSRTDESTAPGGTSTMSPSIGILARCALKLQQPETVLSATNKSLALVDPANLRSRIFYLLLQAKVCIQQEEIAEASSIVTDVTHLTAGSASQLIVQQVNEVPNLLSPWERTKPVRELDERPAAYRPVGSSGNGRTKRT